MTKPAYKKIRKTGFLLTIPFIMAAGPLTGYFIGDYLAHRFQWPSFVILLCMGFGFIAAIQEIIKIIRLTVKEDDKSDE